MTCDRTAFQIVCYYVAIATLYVLEAWSRTHTVKSYYAVQM